MSISSFAPTAYAVLDAVTASSNIVLPTTGTPTVALVSNVSASVVWVALGSSGVTATVGACLPVLPMSSVALTIGTNTNIAAITEAGVAGVSIAVGS